MFEALEQDFLALAPSRGFVSARATRTVDDVLSMQRGILQPPSRSEDLGVMITVHRDGGIGYAATSDLRKEGLRDALCEAEAWAERTSRNAVTDFSAVKMQHSSGEYRQSPDIAWDSVSLGDKVDRLTQWSNLMDIGEQIVDWKVALWRTHVDSLYLTNGGGKIRQEHDYLVPSFSVAANRGGDTAERSLGGGGICRQGGMGFLDELASDARIVRMSEQAVSLLDATQCPSGTMDLVLAPDQMVLQVHESIGHPLELDRILGDERNYAGTSFVTPEMFGSYQYGSEHLNVTFDPTVEDEIASYGFDDEGAAAERVFIIEDGVLQRPLGGAISQARAKMDGVANARATNWNRPAIDRMANLNVESGSKTFEQLVADVEYGVYMETNTSWSIDDSRNKFQFGCEYGRVIVNGQLGDVVKTPNYRGISATFWRNLAGVGNHDSLQTLGSAYCGKGEPNQVIRVGHRTPPCHFRNVAVFGGA